MAAAVPPDHNLACCLKHQCMRELAEADGGQFSNCMVENADDFSCGTNEVSCRAMQGCAPCRSVPVLFGSMGLNCPS